MRISLTEKAYQILKDMIVRYQLKPGNIFTAKELAEAWGMSQTPIREALCILEHERLIERVHKKGYLVRFLDIQEISDLYDLRIAVEVLATEKITGKMTQAQLDELYNILNKLQVFIDKREKRQILEFEQKIHVSILEATDSNLLIETGRSILERIWMLQKIILFTSKHWAKSQRQHLEIVKSLADGDPEKSAALVKKHLSWGKELILKRLHDEDDFLSSIVTGTSEIFQAFQNQTKE